MSLSPKFYVNISDRGWVIDFFCWSVQNFSISREVVEQIAESIMQAWAGGIVAQAMVMVESASDDNNAHHQTSSWVKLVWGGAIYKFRLDLSIVISMKNFSQILLE